MGKMNPNLSEERKLWRRGYKRVACLDEAGRGPLAGPVTAAVVAIKPGFKFQISGFRNIKDSKKLTPEKRERFYWLLIKNPCIEWGIGKVSEKIIDKINILEATKLAMKKAIARLNKKPDFLILDGKMKINLPISQKSIVKADEKVFSCAAASILAKVTRDRIMEKYHLKYPRYRFNQHKGYPTKLHLKMLKKYGSCKIHRKSFFPVKTCKTR
jgi:ribonuclease HII